MILCFLVTDVNMIGTSSNGAMRRRSEASYSFIVLLSLMKRSHLLTTSTQALRLRTMRLNMLMSWASIPLFASIIRMQTSECSIALMERITE